MKKVIFISLVLLIINILASCDKSMPTPTPIDPKTTVHIDTVRCKINGKNWEAVPVKLNGQPFTNAVTAELLTGALLKGDTIVGITAFLLDANKHPTESISFLFGKLNNSNRYQIWNGSSYDGNCSDFKVDTTYSRPVIINHHNKEKGIIKGNFAFKGIAVSKGICKKDTVIVTDGYFSVRY